MDLSSDNLNIIQAAKFLNLKVSRVRNLIFKKQIPYSKIGATIVFNKRDLLRWLEQKKVVRL